MNTSSTELHTQSQSACRSSSKPGKCVVIIQEVAPVNSHRSTRREIQVVASHHQKHQRIAMKDKLTDASQFQSLYLYLLGADVMGDAQTSPEPSTDESTTSVSAAVRSPTASYVSSHSSSPSDKITHPLPSPPPLPPISTTDNSRLTLPRPHHLHPPRRPSHPLRPLLRARVPDDHGQVQGDPGEHR